MPARGLTRKITRKQARSYELTSPNGKRRTPSKGSRRARSNPLGVTAIAAVMNGRGSYAKRYALTRAMLGGKMPRMTTRRRVARRNTTARELDELFEKQMSAAKRTRGPSWDEVAAKRRKPGRKPASKKVVKARRTKQTKAAKRKYTPLKFAGKKTYAYRGPKGKPRKIPLWAIMGASSKKDFERRVADSPRLARRVVAAKKRREKKAAKLLLHGDYFTPNRRRRTRRSRTIPYRTWSKKMEPNKRRRAKKRVTAKQKIRARGKRTRTPAQRRATAKMLAKRWGKRIKARSYWKNPKRRTAKRRAAAKRPRRKLYGAALAAWRKAHGISAGGKRKPARRRRARRNPEAAVMNPRRRRRARRVSENPRRRRRARRNPMYNENKRQTKRSRRLAAKRGWAKRRRAHRNPYSENRRRKAKRYDENPRRRRRARRNPMYNENRRHRARRHARRGYRRNPNIMGQLKTVFKIGAIILVGFVVHRGISYLVSEKLLTKVAALTTGTAAEYRGLIGGVVAAVIGVPLIAYVPVLKAKAGEIGAGIAVSLLQQGLMLALKKMNQPNVAGVLSGYPDASGVAFHSMSGYGAYEMMPPGYAGFGQYTQAAAGYGALTQAAAGYGALTQAAAGYGQLGEYVATGVQGIGEYEAVQGVGGLGYPEQVIEGIHPNLSAAERALSVAEAAAGIGDLPFQSTMNPDMIAAPIMDAPGGSRAGVFEGGEGIFG